VESLADRGEAADEEDDRNVSDLLLDQIEFADVIVLNKIDLIEEKEKTRLLRLLGTLNPTADIIPAANSEVDLGAVINTGKFSFEKASQSAGWLKVSLRLASRLCSAVFSLLSPHDSFISHLHIIAHQSTTQSILGCAPVPPRSERWNLDSRDGRVWNWFICVPCSTAFSFWPIACIHDDTFSAPRTRLERGHDGGSWS